MTAIAYLAYLIFCTMIGCVFATFAGAVLMALMGAKRGAGGFLIAIALIGAFVGLFIGTQN